MTESKSDYEVGPGRPPPHTRFKESQSGTPPRRPPSPQRILRRRRDQAGIAIFGRRHRPHMPRRQRTVAGPQNQTSRAVRALIRLGCRCATRMGAYLPARLPLVGRRAEGYPLTRQNLLLVSPWRSGQGNCSRGGIMPRIHVLDYPRPVAGADEETRVPLHQIDPDRERQVG